MEVYAHEPGEGFEVDEFDFHGVGVGENGLDTAVFLTVAGETALCVEERLYGLDEFLCCFVWGFGLGFGEHEGEFVFGRECVASGHAVFVLDFGRPFGRIDDARIGDLKAHGWQFGVGEGACAFHWAAKYLRKGPVLAVEMVGWEAVLVIVVGLGRVAD